MDNGIERFKIPNLKKSVHAASAPGASEFIESDGKLNSFEWVFRDSLPVAWGIGHRGASAVGGFPDLRRLASLVVSSPCPMPKNSIPQVAWSFLFVVYFYQNPNLL
ncbi:hypothetical protein [Nostoc sp. CHAB 5715]|uniref:hypothetical protein n=1 Tax=Nostoc sp. CHAB 5715 TaxID=2780400 RepID=UPI001E65817E|nr:hypothetical protein [Nostoc sp. CHAB 5715]MCC5625447.1 hypothetical protein [Nostoc sp. CHAB 5715]